MAGSLNKLQLIGSLRPDLEVCNMPSGSEVVNLSIATTGSWTDKRGNERRQQTESTPRSHRR